MPAINNATVATGTGLSTAGNGGRKLVRLSNGWLVSIYYEPSSLKLYLVKSLDGGATWSQLCQIDSGGSHALSNFAIVSNGTRVFVISTMSQSFVASWSIDATTQTNTNIFSTNRLSVDTQSSLGAISLAINDAGTELHAAWSSKNSTYPNSFNIRYAKGTIAADGSVTWGAVEQVTNLNTTSYTHANPSIVINALGYPVIVFQGIIGSDNRNSIRFVYKTGAGWQGTNVGYGSNLYVLSNYEQANPSAIFIPQSINGLANGRLWVAWHGKDATDSAKFNIRTSFSDDGGVTWATPTKQTTGNTYDQTNASITADKTGKVLLYWDGDEDASGNTVTVTKEKVYNGTWGTTASLSGDNHYGVSTLFDRSFSIGMTRAPLIRYYASGVRFTGSYFTGASVSPLSSALGDKTTSSVLSYTVTPESGSTITSIVEKVNGTTVNTYSNPASLSRTFTIPLTNWDALKYYNTHTISVTVTDSNGMVNTQTYTFNKALANDASLLEGTKAAKDGKDRISTKRDALATQVGLPAGSTFDAISAQLASGLALVKRQTGLTNSSGQVINSRYYITVPIGSIGFVPNSFQVFYFTSNTWVPLASVNKDAEISSGTQTQILQPNNSGIQVLDGVNWYISSTEVRIPIGTSVGAVQTKWIAYG